MDILKYLNNEKPIKSSELRNKLIKYGLKLNRCEKCGIEEWNGQPLTILLHHINGDHNDNRLENLLMLCPNCHSLTDTYCKIKNIKKSNVCKICGKLISYGATLCSECLHFSQRKVERPSLEALIKDFKELKSFCKLGEKYKVSDKTISKWFKYYGAPYTVCKLKEYIKLQ